MRISSLLYRSSSKDFRSGSFELINVVRFPRDRTNHVLRRFFTNAPVCLPIHLFNVRLTRRPIRVQGKYGHSIVTHVQERGLASGGQGAFELIITSLGDTIQRRYHKGRRKMLQDVLSKDPPIFMLEGGSAEDGLCFAFLIVHLLLPFQRGRKGIFTGCGFQGLIACPRYGPHFFL